jgi:glutathione S-transferase
LATDGSMATLLHYPLCAFSRSIRLALAECGVEAELAEEKPWEWRAEFLKLNPAGTLPVLLTDAQGAISGSYAISEYLGDTMDERSGVSFAPFPGDATARAEARRLTDWFHRKFFEEVTSYLVEEKVFRRFGPQSWLAGDALSFADLAAAAHLSTLDFLGEVPWEEFEPAKNWYALLKSRPSFRPLLQDRVAGFTPAGTYADLDF